MNKFAPEQKPGRSKQDYRTPPEFIIAVKTLLGIKRFEVDLAADAENALSEIYYDEAMDSLKQSWDWWSVTGWGWCNPPYAHIAPWVKKACESSSCIAMLVPAGVGANWWRDYVHEQCKVKFLNGRLTFVRCTAPYPKDCALLLYHYYIDLDYDVWTWKSGTEKERADE